MVLEWIKKNILVIVMAVVIVGLIAWIAIPKKTEPSGAKEAIEAVAVKLEEQYQKQMAVKDEQIKIYQAKILASEKKYQEIMIKVRELQRMKDNVKEPKNATESGDRFNVLGFTPVKQQCR